MGDKSKIEWTDASWNPVTGCSHVSPGCDHCYAETLSHRYKWTTKPWGAQHAVENVKLHPERLDQPLRWRRPRRVFVNSMSDLFHERVPDEFLSAVFGVMAAARHHVFQVLTKRPGRMLAHLREVQDDDRDMNRWQNAVNRLVPHRLVTVDCDWPPANVWLGVSVEDQRRADERIPLLLETPAAVRWVSAEPLLESLDLDGTTWLYEAVGDQLGKLDWVVVGGESGPGARPFDVAWAQDILQRCRASGVAAFMKQLGSNVRWNGRPAWPWAADYAVPINGGYDGFRARLRDRKGGDPSEWPEDLRVREYPR